MNIFDAKVEKSKELQDMLKAYNKLINAMPVPDETKDVLKHVTESTIDLAMDEAFNQGCEFMHIRYQLANIPSPYPAS